MLWSRVEGRKEHKVDTSVWEGELDVLQEEEGSQSKRGPADQRGSLGPDHAEPCRSK